MDEEPLAAPCAATSSAIWAPVTWSGLRRDRRHQKGTYTVGGRQSPQPLRGREVPPAPGQVENCQVAVHSPTPHPGPRVDDHLYLPVPDRR